MKKITLLILVLMLSIGLSAADGKKAFTEDSRIIDVSLGFSEFTTPIAVGYEHAISPNLGIDVSALFLHWAYDLGYLGDLNQTLVMPQVHLNYHFTKIKSSKWDLFVGAGAGYSIYDSDWLNEPNSGGIFLSGVFGFRFYLSEKIALQARETVVIVGDWGGSYTLVGVSFSL